MNIADAILARGADAAIAILHRQTRLTYGELRQRVHELAGQLLRQNYQTGDRIGILSENNAFFVIAYLAVIHAELVAVPLQTELRDITAAKIASESGMKALLVSRRFLRKAQSWATAANVRLLAEGETHHSGTETKSPERNGVAKPEAAGAISGNRLAALMFTSGSTGVPKGVMVSHRNIECNTLDIIHYMGLSPNDRVMVVLPFHYCFGASLLHTHLMCGGSLVLNNDFKLYPESMLREMRETECTGLAGVPSTYQILLRKSRFGAMQFPNLRWFQQAGGKLPNPCIGEIRQCFPQVRYFLMYGQTEGTARLSYLPPDRLQDKLGSIGMGLPSTRLQVLKQDGTAVAADSSEIGEIVAEGDNIALGYWHDPNETAKFFRNGRLHTGDIARVDGDGFIYVVEREREMIKSGGNRVSAKEVEDVIAELPEVVEVAVVGTPHPLLGEAIKAFVATVPNRMAKPRDIEAHCQKRLPPHAVPEEVIIIENMPHNEAGKVLKTNLKAMLAQRPNGT